MRNRYPGICYKCGKHIPVGYGFFERYRGGWRLQCVKCCDGRDVKDTDKEVKRAWKMRAENES